MVSAALRKPGVIGMPKFTQGGRAPESNAPVAEPKIGKTLQATIVQLPPMQQKLIRVLVAVLVALVVPLQGAAAVAAGQCMALGHHQEGGPDQPHVHDGSDDAAGVHEHSGQTAVDTAVEGSEEGAKNPHCGPCAACCSSVSIAGNPSLPILGAPANTKYLLSQSPLRGSELRSIERPPLAL